MRIKVLLKVGISICYLYCSPMKSFSNSACNLGLNPSDGNCPVQLLPVSISSSSLSPFMVSARMCATVSSTRNVMLRLMYGGVIVIVVVVVVEASSSSSKPVSNQRGKERDSTNCL